MGYVADVVVVVELEVLLAEDAALDEEELNDEVDEVAAGTVTCTVTTGLTSIIEYPVAVTVVGLGECVRVTTNVCVVSDPSIVFVETM